MRVGIRKSNAEDAEGAEFAAEEGGEEEARAHPGIIPQNTRDGAAVTVPQEKKRGAARYSPYRQRLRPSAPGSLRREAIGAESATWTAPGQIEFEGTARFAALTLAEPDALQLPGLQKGSEKHCLKFYFLLAIEVEILQLSFSDSFRMTSC